MLPTATEHQQALRRTRVALVFWSLAMLLVCGLTGAKHDYHSYLRQWQGLLEGLDPWSAGNAYGPLHNIIGFLLYLNPLAPKFIIVGALLLANAALVLESIRVRGTIGTRRIQAVYFLAIPTNVLFISVGVIYGLNDALVAALLVAAVLMRHQGKFAACGVMVGLAALTKYYPLLLLPFFALDERRLRWSVIIGGAVVFSAGFAAAVAVWGDGPIRAIAFGSERGPKLLSVIKALSSVFGEENISILIKYDAVIVVSGVAAALLYAWWARLNWLEGVVIGYLVMLMLYKVGHQQFYLPWLFMVASLAVVSRESADRMAVIFLPLVIFLSVYQLGYAADTGRYEKHLRSVRDYGGFLAFFISVASIAACIGIVSGDARKRAQAATPISPRADQSA